MNDFFNGILVLIFMSLSMITIALYIDNNDMKKEAIIKGYATYDNKTLKWKWKDN